MKKLLNWWTSLSEVEKASTARRARAAQEKGLQGIRSRPELTYEIKRRASAREDAKT